MRGTRDDDRSHEAPERRASTARKVKNEHGTRVSVRVTCSVCGCEDSIDFAPKDPSRAMCRKCAFEVLDVSDPDVRALSVHHHTCEQCGANVELPVGRDLPTEILCRDCLAGIESKQGDRAIRGTKSHGGRVVRVSRRSEGK